MLQNVNWLAVLVAFVASNVLGMLWFSALFGKAWIKTLGRSAKELAKMKKSSGRSMVIGAIGTLVTVFVLGAVLRYTEATAPMHGAMVGFWVWLGFVAPVMMGPVIWSRTSTWKRYVIEASYQLVNLAMLGAILASF